MGHFNNKNWQPRQNNNEAPQQVVETPTECPTCENNNSMLKTGGTFVAGVATGAIATWAAPKLWNLGKKGWNHVKGWFGSKEEEEDETPTPTEESK